MQSPDGGRQTAPMADVWDDTTPIEGPIPGPAGGFIEPARAEPVREEHWRTVVRTIGELLVTGGVIVLLFVVYELFVTDLLNGQRQEDLDQQVHEQWSREETSSSPRPQVPGDAFAVLHIPRLGDDYHRVVVEGTSHAALKDGPGHYSDSAQPGEVGNLAIAGHRTTYGSPFRDLDLVRPGDPIVVETADSWFVYRVLGDPATGDFDTDPSGITGLEIVTPEDVQVINPVPDAAVGTPPTHAYLTLTTCHPRFSAAQRLIVHAELDGTPIAKADMPDGPPALTEG
jgi:sortase (surface protein transpeptidase)